MLSKKIHPILLAFCVAITLLLGTRLYVQLRDHSYFWYTAMLVLGVSTIGIALSSLVYSRKLARA